MRKSTFLMILSALFVLISCEQEDMNVIRPAGDGFTLIGNSSIKTKTAFGSPGERSIPFMWSVGDMVTVNGTDSKQLTGSDINTDGTTANFTFESGSVNKGDIVEYGCLDYNGNVWVLPWQDGDDLGCAGDYARGTVDDNNSFALTHYTSYLWLDPYSTEVTKKVTKAYIKAANDIVGSAAFDPSILKFGRISSIVMDEAPELSDTKVITVEFWGEDGAEPRGLPAASSDEDIWASAVTFPVTTGGLEVTYEFEDGSVASYQWESKALEPGRTYRLSSEIKKSDFYQLKTLTFEDADAKFESYTLNYCSIEISDWSDLISDDQYGGEIIYSYSQSEEDHYSWYDGNNTLLAHDFPYNYSMYWFAGGGHAISHYATKNYNTYGDYTAQLTVYDKDGSDDIVTTGGGHNGSDNFAVHYGYYDNSGYNQTTEDVLPAIYFADGRARVIDHLWVNLTTYEYCCLLIGNGFTAAMGEGDYVEIRAIGHKEDGTTVRTSIRVADYVSGIIDDWTKWDLSLLGKVKKVQFNIIGTNDNGYGFSQPAYFAYDDVAVRFEIEN